MNLARLTGGLYLLYILTMVLSDVFAHIGPSGLPALAEALQSGGLSFRVGIVLSLVSALFFVLVAWGLYAILRPVQKELALLFLLLNAVGVAIHCASVFPLIPAMLQADPAGQLQSLSAAVPPDSLLLAAGSYKVAFVVSQLFFSAWLFPLGYLVYTSRALPRALGILLLADGVAVLLWFLQEFLLPEYPAIRTPGLVVSFAAEFGLALWLLAKGVKE